VRAVRYLQTLPNINKDPLWFLHPTFPPLTDIRIESSQLLAAATVSFESAAYSDFVDASSLR